MSDISSGKRTPLDRIRSRFLRSIVNDMNSFILPNLTSGDAQERAQYISLVLSRFAHDCDVTPAALSRMAGAFELQLKQSIDLLRAHTVASDAAAQLSSKADKLFVSRTTSDQYVFALRTLLGACVRLLSDINPRERSWPDAQRELKGIADVEGKWLDMQASVADRYATPETSRPGSVYQRLTPDTVTRYLRQSFAKWPEIAATSVEVLAGGRSKKTALIAITGDYAWPQDIVLRQDSGMTHMGTNVGGEVVILKAIQEERLPIPRILHFEPDKTELGPAFLLMDRLRGRPAGSFFSFSVIDRGLLTDVAQTLARLHQLDPTQLGLSGSSDEHMENERLRDLVSTHWTKWRRDAVEPSPIMEYAFNWLLRMCDQPLRGNAVVHGDYRPQNFLTENGRLTGILDWEFAHIGSPAEDLAYLRSTLPSLMPWPEFIGLYEAAGGEKYDETTFRIYDVWWMLRLGALAGGAVEGLLDGTTDDFPQGAGGYVVVPMFEKRLTQLLRKG